MADAIATPDFALGDSNIGEFIIDLAAADSAVELGPFVGVSMVDLVSLSTTQAKSIDLADGVSLTVKQ